MLEGPKNTGELTGLNTGELTGLNTGELTGTVNPNILADKIL